MQALRQSAAVLNVEVDSEAEFEEWHFQLMKMASVHLISEFMYKRISGVECVSCKTGEPVYRSILYRP